MILLRSHRDAIAKPSRLPGITLIACCFAALLMVVGASYASAHDHDSHGDHDAGFGGECVVCSVAALGAAKLSPDEPATIAPQETLIGVRPLGRVLIAESFHTNSYPVRGPPLSIPFC